MFDNTNPYTLWTVVAEGITQYFVSFSDGQAVHRETEVSQSVYLEFCRFVKKERNLRRWDERHTEQSLLTDETLHRRALYPPKSVEDTAYYSSRNKQLRLAMQSLPEIQRRRFVQYHEFGLTYEQIAEIEGCSHVAIISSVRKAQKLLTEILK